MIHFGTLQTSFQISFQLLCTLRHPSRDEHVSATEKGAPLYCTYAKLLGILVGWVKKKVCLKMFGCVHICVLDFDLLNLCWYSTSAMGLLGHSTMGVGCLSYHMLSLLRFKWWPYTATRRVVVFHSKKILYIITLDMAQLTPKITGSRNRTPLCSK